MRVVLREVVGCLGRLRARGGTEAMEEVSACFLSLSGRRLFSTSDLAETEKQKELDMAFVKDRRAWKAKLKDLRKQYAEEWEALDKSVLRKTKLKRKEGYQPLNREVLMESARKRWQENEERKANLRLLEEGWLKGKEERAKKRDKVMDVVDKERQAAEARRLLWLMERSEEWVPEENLDLAIAAAILEPTEL
ncbi:hypothetical protein HOP50_04g33370 [Chloropicon primus]|uniref:Uncharacterized protein n=1 Tax=Chloropicon primus TaxID=1764295 RepID=A0A5B8MK13_9CHLO|nr:hypothetical protein A3770_04p33340 [Chloropicon primus]UPR00028.1 hypothetical protein HOP50_04g33370 [Chloropicon primus]|eukprot:QDZ20816.1 hypothetical protein A3770_04p33340 [Chloropicon primus]